MLSSSGNCEIRFIFLTDAINNLMIDIFKRAPATISLLVVNVLVFVFCYLDINTFKEPAWSLNLLKWGAEFSPYTLDRQWYRIFTHMFLHGHIIHLAFNMYALYSVGTDVEQISGTHKFLMVYFVSGVASALNSLYWNMFDIGVGASGAIFGVFGFSLMISIVYHRKQGNSIAPVVLNFVLFLGINLFFASSLHADTAAHLGGLAAGAAIGFASVIFGHSFRSVKIEYALIPLLIAVYFTLPRYPVTYFKFIEKVLAIEDSTHQIFTKTLTNQDFANALKRYELQWDTARMMLNAQPPLPVELQSDTLKLSHYIALRKQEDRFRVTMIERESYIYRDSLDLVDDSIKSFLSLEYSASIIRVLNANRVSEPQQEKQNSPNTTMTQVWYDSDWNEIAGTSGTYYRIGGKDSIGQWQGTVTDFYANDKPQMKGEYADNKRDGIFIYYSDHNTYTSAGRYKGDQNVGKWETYHHNGKLESEIYYNDGYYLKNLWDSTGTLLVKDGNGKVTERYANGLVSSEGDYKDGRKQGYWYGRYENGDMFFEENFNQGHLVNGRSKSKSDAVFTYDETSLYPLPEGGYPKLNTYLKSEALKTKSPGNGIVKLSFRVTAKSVLADVNVETSASEELDERAKNILLNGPTWIPAKLHGQKAIDGYALLKLEFANHVP